MISTIKKNEQRNPPMEDLVACYDAKRAEKL